MADDAASADQVRPLLPGTAGCAVVVTSRSRLGGLAGAQSHCLDPLPHADAVEMLARIVGSERVADEADASDRLVKACGCLPLAVRIAGAKLVTRPSWPIRTVAEAVADQAAADVVNLLVDRSLLMPTGTDATGRPRYRLLGLLRDFAIEQLSLG
jgi:hypothetical protein